MPTIPFNKRFNTDSQLRQELMDKFGLSQEQLDALSAFFLRGSQVVPQSLAVRLGSAVRHIQENSHTSPALAGVVLDQVTEYVGEEKNRGLSSQVIANSLGMSLNDVNEFVYKAERDQLRYGAMPNGFSASPQRKILSKMNFWRGDSGAAKEFRSGVESIVGQIKRNLEDTGVAVHIRNMPDTMGGHVELRFQATSDDMIKRLNEKQNRRGMAGSTYFEDGLKISMINGQPVWNTTGHSGWYRDVTQQSLGINEFVDFATKAVKGYTSGKESTMSKATGLANNSGDKMRWWHVQEDVFMTQFLPGQQLALDTRTFRLASDKFNPREFITYNKDVDAMRRPMEMLTSGYGAYQDENGNIITGEYSVSKSIKRMGTSGVHRNSMLGYRDSNGNFIEERRSPSTLLPQNAPKGYTEYSYVADALVFPFSHPALAEGQGVVSNKFAPVIAETLEQQPDKWGIELPDSISADDVISYFEGLGYKIKKGAKIGGGGTSYVFDKTHIVKNGQRAKYFEGDTGRHFKNWKQFEMTGFSIYNPIDEEGNSGNPVIYPTGRVSSQAAANYAVKAGGIKAYISQAGNMRNLFGDENVDIALSRPSGKLQFMHSVLSYMPEDMRREYWVATGHKAKDMPTKWMDLSHKMTTSEQLAAWEEVYRKYLSDNYRIINQTVTVSSDGLKSLFEAGQAIKGTARSRGAPSPGGARFYDVDISVPAYKIRIPISAKYESQSQKSSQIGLEENTLLKSVAPHTYNRLLGESQHHLRGYKAIEEAYKLNVLGMSADQTNYKLLNIKEVARDTDFMRIYNEILPGIQRNMPGANVYEHQNRAISEALDQYAKQKFGDDADYLLVHESNNKLANIRGTGGGTSYIVPPKTMEYFSYEDNSVLGLLGGSAYTNTLSAVSNMIRWFKDDGKGLKKAAISRMMKIAEQQVSLLRHPGFRANASALHSTTIINAKYGSAAAVGENEVMRSDIAIARMFGVDPSNERDMAALKEAARRGELKELSWRNPLVNAEAQTSMILNIITEDMMRERRSSVKLDDAYGAVYNENSPMASGGDQDSDESKGVSLSRLVRLDNKDAEAHALRLMDQYGAENVSFPGLDDESGKVGEYAIINERDVSDVQDIVNAATIHSAGEKQSRAKKILMRGINLVRDASKVLDSMVDFNRNGFSTGEISLQTYEQASLLGRQIGHTYNLYRRLLHNASNDPLRQRLISKIGEWNYQGPLDRKPWAAGSPEADAIEFINSFSVVSGKAKTSSIDTRMLSKRVSDVLKKIDQRRPTNATRLAGFISDIKMGADDIYGEIDRLYKDDQEMHGKVTDAVTKMLFGGEITLPDGMKKTFSSRGSASNLYEFELRGNLSDGSILTAGGKYLVGVYKKMLDNSPKERGSGAGQDVKFQIAALFTPSSGDLSKVANAFENLSSPEGIYDVLGDEWHMSDAPMAQVLRGMGVVNAFKEVQRKARHLNDKAGSPSKVKKSDPALFLQNVIDAGAWIGKGKQMPDKLSPRPRKDGVGRDTFEAIKPLLSDYTNVMMVMGASQKNKSSFYYLNTAEWMLASQHLNPDFVGDYGLPSIENLPKQRETRASKTAPPQPAPPPPPPPTPQPAQAPPPQPAPAPAPDKTVSHANPVVGDQLTNDMYISAYQEANRVLEEEINQQSSRASGTSTPSAYDYMSIYEEMSDILQKELKQSSEPTPAPAPPKAQTPLILTSPSMAKRRSAPRLYQAETIGRNNEVAENESAQMDNAVEEANETSPTQQSAPSANKMMQPFDEQIIKHLGFEEGRLGINITDVDLNQAQLVGRMVETVSRVNSTTNIVPSETVQGFMGKTVREIMKLALYEDVKAQYARNEVKGPRIESIPGYVHAPKFRHDGKEYDVYGEIPFVYAEPNADRTGTNLVRFVRYTTSAYTQEEREAGGGVNSAYMQARLIKEAHRTGNLNILSLTKKFSANGAKDYEFISGELKDEQIAYKDVGPSDEVFVSMNEAREPLEKLMGLLDGNSTKSRLGANTKFLMTALTEDTDDPNVQQSLRSMLKDESDYELAMQLATEGGIHLVHAASHGLQDVFNAFEEEGWTGFTDNITEGSDKLIRVYSKGKKRLVDEGYVRRVYESLKKRNKESKSPVSAGYREYMSFVKKEMGDYSEEITGKRIPGYAKGAEVRGAHLAVVGDNTPGYPEYIVPGEKTQMLPDGRVAFNPRDLGSPLSAHNKSGGVKRYAFGMFSPPKYTIDPTSISKISNRNKLTQIPLTDNPQPPPPNGVTPPTQPPQQPNGNQPPVIKGYYKFKSPEISAEYIGKVEAALEMVSNPTQRGIIDNLAASGNQIPKGHVLSQQISDAASVYKDLRNSVQYAHDIISGYETQNNMKAWMEDEQGRAVKIDAYQNMRARVEQRFGQSFDTYYGDSMQNGAEIYTPEAYEEIKGLYQKAIGTSDWKQRTKAQQDAWREWKLFTAAHEQVVTKGGTFSGAKIVSNIGGAIRGISGGQAKLAQKLLDTVDKYMPGIGNRLPGKGKWFNSPDAEAMLAVGEKVRDVLPSIPAASGAFQTMENVADMTSAEAIDAELNIPGSVLGGLHTAAELVASSASNKVSEGMQQAAAKRRELSAASRIAESAGGVDVRLSEARIDSKNRVSNMVMDYFSDKAPLDKSALGKDAIHALKTAKMMSRGDKLTGLLSADEARSMYSTWNKMRREYLSYEPAPGDDSVKSNKQIKAQQKLAEQMNAIRDTLVSYNDDMAELRKVTGAHIETIKDTISASNEGIEIEKAVIRAKQKVLNAQNKEIKNVVSQFNEGKASVDDIKAVTSRARQTNLQIKEAESRLEEHQVKKGEAQGMLEAISSSVPKLSAAPRKVTAQRTNFQNAMNALDHSALNPRNMFYDVQNLAQMQYMIKEPLNRKRDIYLASEYARGQMEAALGGGEISPSLKRFQAETALERSGSIAFGRGVDWMSSLGMRNMMGRLVESGHPGIVEGMGKAAQAGATILDTGYKGYFGYRLLKGVANTAFAFSPKLGAAAKNILPTAGGLVSSLSSAALFGGGAVTLGAAALVGGAGILGLDMAYNHDVGGWKSSMGGASFGRMLSVRGRQLMGLTGYYASRTSPFQSIRDYGESFISDIGRDISEEDKLRLAKEAEYEKTTFAKLKNIRDDNGDSRMSDDSIVNTISSFGSITGMSLSELDSNKGGMQDTMVALSTRMLDLGVTPDQLDQQVGVFAKVPQMLGLPTGSPMMAPILGHINDVLQSGNLTDVNNLMNSYSSVASTGWQAGLSTYDINKLADAYGTIATNRGPVVANRALSKVNPMSNDFTWSRAMQAIGAESSMTVDPNTGLSPHQTEVWAMQDATTTRSNQLSSYQEIEGIREMKWQNAFDNRQWHIQQQSREAWGDIQSSSYALNETRAWQAYNRRKQYVEEIMPMQNEQFGIQAQIFNMQAAYKRQGFDIQASRMATQWDWQQQDFSKQQERLDLQYSWQQQDFADNRQMFEMQAGWQTEDMRRSMRYATGRQRIDLRRQYERQLILQQEKRDQMSKQEARAAAQHGMSQEDLDTAKSRAQTKHDWGVEDLERARKYFEDMLPLQERLMKISEESSKIQQQAAVEELDNLRKAAEIATAQREQYEIDRNNQRDAINEQHAEDLRRKAFVLWMSIQRQKENDDIRKNNETIKNWDREHKQAVLDLNKVRDEGIEASAELSKEEIDKYYEHMRKGLDDFIEYAKRTKIYIPITLKGDPSEEPVQDKKYAYGGSVNKPTRALIGEAGGEEYVVPQNGALVIRGDNRDREREVNILTQMLDVLVAISQNTKSGNNVVDVEGAVARMFNLALG